MRHFPPYLKFKTPALLFCTALSAFFTSTGCGERPADQAHLDVTDVNHTPAKRQSIGNCWLYATATWAESLSLTETSEIHNLSESYWTYWHWYENIKYAGDKIDTGGSWATASSIILNHGWMEESEFISAEANSEMSAAQARAEIFVNQQLAKGGKLATVRSRTKKNIMVVLDEAFGVDMTAASARAHKAEELLVGHTADGAKLTLNDVISTSDSSSSWRQVSYPTAYSENQVLSDAQIAKRLTILKRVMKALNDRQPVIMSVEVDFNALKTTPYATFDLDTLHAAGQMGRQGGHMLVLEDYTVKNVPNVGEIGEGDVSPELKAAALLGDLTSLKAKNSWGTDRPERGLIDGHTSFNINYLDAVLSWKDSEDGESSGVSWRNPLNQFILPAGY